MPIHRNERHVYTCGGCVNGIPKNCGIFCPIYKVVVSTQDKACSYHNIRHK